MVAAAGGGCGETGPGAAVRAGSAGVRVGAGAAVGVAVPRGTADGARCGTSGSSAGVPSVTFVPTQPGSQAHPVSAIAPRREAQTARDMAPESMRGMFKPYEEGRSDAVCPPGRGS